MGGQELEMQYFCTAVHFDVRIEGQYRELSVLQCDGSRSVIVHDPTVVPSAVEIQLPTSFSSFAHILGLHGDLSVSVRVACMAGTLLPVFLRIYISYDDINAQVSKWGTLRHATQWRAALFNANNSYLLIREDFSEGIASESEPASLLRRIKHAEETQFQGLPLSLCKSAGHIHFADFGQPSSLFHRQTPRSEWSRKGGLLRFIDASFTGGADELELLLVALCSGSKDSEAQQPGATTLATRCSLIIVSDETFGHMCDTGLCAASGLLSARTLQDLRGISIAAVQASSVLLVAESAIFCDEDLKGWQQQTVDTFAQASARISSRGADAALPLSFDAQDRVRHFVASISRAPGTWCVPPTLFCWQRVVCEFSTHTFLGLLSYAALWLYKRESLAETVHPTVNAALSAAESLGAVDVINSPDAYAAMCSRTITVVAHRRLRPRARIDTVKLTPSEDELSVRRLFRSQVESALPPSVEFRILVGAYPSSLSYDKTLASLFGGNARTLMQLQTQFAPSQQTEFAKDVLSAWGSRDAECSVCMSEPPNVITSCGHVYCSECSNQIVRGASMQDVLKCCVCRCPTFRDDFWKVLPGSEEPRFRQTALIEAIDGLQRSQCKSQELRTLVIAVNSLSEAVAVHGRLAQTFGETRARLASTLDEGGTSPSFVDLQLAPCDFIVCPVSDLQGDVLGQVGIETLVVLGASLPCFAEQSGSQVARAYVPWSHALTAVLNEWCLAKCERNQAWQPPRVVIVEVAEMGTSTLEAELSSSYIGGGDKVSEPERKPRSLRDTRRYELRSGGGKPVRACQGSEI